MLDFIHNAPVICMPCPFWPGIPGHRGLKCQDLTYGMSLQCPECAKVLISCLNMPLQKEPV